MTKKNHNKMRIGSILAACILILIGLSTVLTAKPININEGTDKPAPDYDHYRGFIWGRIEDPSFESGLNIYLRFYAFDTYFFGTVTNSNSLYWHFMKFDERYYNLDYGREFKGIFTKRIIFGIYNG